MPEHPQDRTGHAFLLFSYPGLMRNSWTLRNGANAAEMTAASDLSTDSGDTLRTWCVAGLRISLGELWDVYVELGAGRLVRVLPTWDEEASPIRLVRAKRKPVPMRLSAFDDLLAQLWRVPPWEGKSSHPVLSYSSPL